MLLYVFDRALDGSQHNAGNIADCRAKVQHCCGTVMLTDDGKFVAMQKTVRIQSASNHSGIGDAVCHRVSQKYRRRVFVEFFEERSLTCFLISVEIIFHMVLCRDRCSSV